MTNLEHLIENCLCEFEKGRSSEEIKQAIKKDINFENADITAEQCYESRYRLNDFYISDIGPIKKEKVIAWAELPTYKE